MKLLVEGLMVISELFREISSVIMKIFQKFLQKLLRNLLKWNLGIFLLHFSAKSFKGYYMSFSWKFSMDCANKFSKDSFMTSFRYSSTGLSKNTVRKSFNSPKIVEEIFNNLPSSWECLQKFFQLGGLRVSKVFKNFTINSCRNSL